MIKQFSKHFSYDVIKDKDQLNSLTYRDFLIFRKKFCGAFVFRGKKSFSMKIFHYILSNFKNIEKNVNPMELFFIIAKRVVPFLTVKQKKYGKSNIAVPSFIFGNKKNLFLLNWIVKTMKNKSNIHGIKKEDVLKNLLDIYKFRGIVLKLKEEHNNKVRLTRINLKNEGVTFSNFAFYQWQRKNFIKAKYDYWKSEIIRLNEDLQFTNEEVEDEFQYWKKFEVTYKYINKVNYLNKKISKKNRNLMRDYKKLFVK